MPTSDVPPLSIRLLSAPAEARACARMMARSEPWITLRRTDADGLKLLRDPGKETYVARTGGALVGFVILDLRGPLRGYLQTIGVWPEWRGRGIGRRLIDFAEKRILRESPNVFLCVSSFNPQAQRLYARLGYQPVGELKNHLVQGHSEILLRKTLGPWSEWGRPRTRPRL